MKRAEYEKRYKRLEKVSAALSVLFTIASIYLVGMWDMVGDGETILDRLRSFFAQTMPFVGSWFRGALVLLLPLGVTLLGWWLALVFAENIIGLKCSQCGRGLAVAFSTRYLLKTGLCVQCNHRVLEDPEADSEELGE